MKIALFSNLYSPEPTGVGVYSGELAAALAEAGHEVSVIAANPSYPQWQLYDGYPAWKWTARQENGVKVHRTPVYIPAAVSGAKRMLHYGTFAAGSAFPAIKLARTLKPDVVFLAAPTLLAAPVALALARASGAASWLHIQDFEVEAGFATGQLKSDGMIARAALGFERRMMSAFDRTSSISPEMCRKLVEKGCDPAKVVELRNWSDLSTIVPQDSSHYRETFGITTPHVALYSGAIAMKQGLETIIDAARALRDRSDLTFVVCGNGPSRADLEASASDLTNIKFFDLQPKEALSDLLALASVHLLPQKAEAADLLLPSKLTNMMASGIPVVAGVHQGTGLAREVEGCGIIVPPENPEEMAAAITRLLDTPAQREELGKAARQRAYARWDRSKILAGFENEVQQLVGAAQTA